MNPPVIHQGEVLIPRDTVLHHLDIFSDSRFPVRSEYYYREVPDSKKLPIHHVTELVRAEGTSTLNNKLLPADIRRWNRGNLKHFRARDLLEVPNKDVNMLGTFNYNPVKDLWNYKSSLLSEWQRHDNLSVTLWSNVRDALRSDKDSIQLIPINVPENLPGYAMMNRLLSFDKRKLIRVVTDVRLLWILELYEWLKSDKRTIDSPLSEITDADSNRILIEFKFRGYSSFLPLNILRGVSENSELESSMKVSPERTEKLFILLLRRIQSSVISLEEQTETSDQEEQVERDDSLNEDDIKTDPLLNDDTDEEEEVGDRPVELKEVSVMNDKSSLLNLKSLDDLDKLKDFEIDESLSNLIDREIDYDQFVDNSISDRIRQIESNPVIVDVGNVDDRETEDEEELDVVPLPEISEAELSVIVGDIDPEESLNRYIEKVSEEKSVPASEIRSLRTLQERRKVLKDPYENTKIDDFVMERPTDIKLDELSTKLDVDLPMVNEALLHDKNSKFDSKYIKEVLDKDVVSCVTNLEKADIVIKDYIKEDVVNSTDSFETHVLTIKPIEGKESTIYFRIPKIDEEGTFMVTGTKYRMRKNRQPLPIVKVSPIRVALSSNYGKFFVSRSERKTNDRDDYILKFIREDYLNESEVVTKIIPGKKTLNKQKLPNIYHTLCSNFNEIRTKEYTFLLRKEDPANHLDQKVSDSITREGYFFVGYNRSKEIIVVGMDNLFYNFSKKMELVGTIENIFKLDPEKVPKPFSVMKVLGSDIPLGVCLSYYLGLAGLLKLTGTKWKAIGPRERYTPVYNELVLRFSNHKLVVVTDTVEKELLFNGFLHYKDTTKRYPLRSFNSKEVYLNLLEQRRNGLIHLKELDVLRKLFIDPITTDVLKDMKEPTSFIPLVLRANELLKDYSHPDINDPNYIRIRGYDRVPGLMYRALAEAVREHHIKGRGNSKISIDPYKVWNYITRDSSVKSRDNLNPLLTMKENEAVVLTGTDSLSNDAIPAGLRRYHPNDVGLISEGTVDSKDVAVTTYLSPYAKVEGVRGTVDTNSREAEELPSKIYSSAAQVAPMVDHDDMKRINFVGIQASHTTPSSGYRQPTVRTGYDYIAPHRSSTDFCSTAKEDGVVKDITDKLITIEYKSGEEVSYPVGDTYGEMEGSVYLHELVSDLKKGSRIKKDEPIAYHKDFFERDWLDPSKLVLKTTSEATVAIMMNNEVFEDSSAISKKFAETMGTTIVEERKFVLDFKQNITNLLPVGTEVKPEDILFMALDETSDGVNLSEQTLSVLQNLASLSPRARVRGVIDRLEIKYNGDLEDMSPSIRKIARQLDKEIYERTKGTPYPAKDNKVNMEYRSSGKGLLLDTLEFKVFIRVGLGTTTGDKLVFGNQLKSVIGDVFEYNLHTESGQEVDAMFSMVGILNRVATSSFTVGTSTRLIKHFNKQVTDTYFGNK